MDSYGRRGLLLAHRWLCWRTNVIPFDEYPVTFIPTTADGTCNASAAANAESGDASNVCFLLSECASTTLQPPMDPHPNKVGDTTLVPVENARRMSPAETLTPEKLMPLSVWKDSTQEAGRTKSDLAQSLIDLEKLVIAKKQFLSPERRSTAQQHG
jgi:hypothetical protein